MIPPPRFHMTLFHGVRAPNAALRRHVVASLRPPPPWPKMWQTWLPGHKPPHGAVEIVSEDWRKDYEDAPLKYAQLGTRELVIFDPGATVGAERRGQRVPLQRCGPGTS